MQCLCIFKMAECIGNPSKLQHLQYLYENVSDDVHFFGFKHFSVWTITHRTILKSKQGKSMKRKKEGGRPRYLGSNELCRIEIMVIRNRIED